MSPRMADFESLNHTRLETLHKMAEVIHREEELWNRYFNGEQTPEIVAAIEEQKRQFRQVYDQHEAARQALHDAGFIKPLKSQPPNLRHLAVPWRAGEGRGGRVLSPI